MSYPLFSQVEFWFPGRKGGIHKIAGELIQILTINYNCIHTWKIKAVRKFDEHSEVWYWDNERPDEEWRQRPVVWQWRCCGAIGVVVIRFGSERIAPSHVYHLKEIRAFTPAFATLVVKKLDGPLSTATLTRPRWFLDTSPALSGALWLSTTQSEGNDTTASCSYST